MSRPFLPADGSAMKRWTRGAANEIVKKAHDDAVLYLRDEFDGNEDVISWLGQPTTIEDVQHRVAELEEKYRSQVGSGKVRKRLHKFSTVVLHYGTALDMLTQQTPQYVSLIWGTIKFILLSFTNHAKLVVGYSEALCYIAEVLPRAQLNMELYNNDTIQESVSRLYEQILLFFRPAIKWYTSSRLKRATAAVFSPFESGLKDVIDKIKTCAAAMDEVARSSMAIDVGVTRTIVTQHLQDLSARQGDMCVQVDTIGEDQKLQLEILHKLWQSSQASKPRVKDIKARVRRIDFRMEYATLKPQGTQPTQSLMEQRTVNRRNRNWTLQTHDVVTLTRSLGEWIDSPNSSLLTVDALGCKGIAAELVGGILQPKSQRVCWCLSEMDAEVTVSGILSSLAWQLYELDPDNAPKDLDGSLNRNDVAEMAELLRLILVQVKDCYLIVEAIDLAGSDAGVSQLNTVLQDLVDRLASEDCCIKVLLFSQGQTTVATSAQRPPQKSRKVISLRPPAPIPVGGPRRTFLQDPGWLQLQHRVKKRS